MNRPDRITRARSIPQVTAGIIRPVEEAATRGAITRMPAQVTNTAITRSSGSAGGPDSSSAFPVVSVAATRKGPIGSVSFVLSALLLSGTVAGQSLVEKDTAYGLTLHNQIMASNNTITSGEVHDNLEVIFS